MFEINSRLYYIDNLKAFLIILVVLGHVIQTSDMDFDHNILFRYIYSFHMPLFMYVSGFVCYKPSQSWGVLKKRFRQLMLPFLSWAFINACLVGDFSVLIKNIFHPDTALWFLWVLFFITILYVACVKLGEQWNIKSEYIVIAVVAIGYSIMIVLKFKYFGFQFIAWYFPFFCLGAYMRKYESYIKRWMRILMCPCFILFLVSAYWWMRKEPPLFMNPSANVIYNYIYKGGVALLAVTSILTIFNRMGGVKNHYFNMLGRETLGIYAIHLFLLGRFYEWFVSCFDSFYIVSVVLFTFVLLVVSHYIYRLLSICHWTARFLLGIEDRRK